VVCFVAVILKVLLVNLLAALNFANVFLNKKRLENKNVKKTLKRDQNKNVKNVFTSMVQRDDVCHRAKFHVTGQNVAELNTAIYRFL